MVSFRLLSLVCSFSSSQYPQSYYATGRQLLPDAEFDLLKEDLQWSGSELVSLNRQEARYLAAMQAYSKGTPMLSDTEFDELKRELKEQGSKFAVSRQPKCLIDTGVCTVTLQEDKFRSNLLYVPALAILTSIWLGPVFEIVAFTTLRFNPLFFLLVGAYPIFLLSKFITEELLFPKRFIAYGPCPSCEVENRVYFGNILGVEGFSDLAEVKCPNCKTEFQVQRASLRASTLPKA
jgi:Zn ribbon nucleic-acid-binding protein